jgi:hypothetical protein
MARAFHYPAAAAAAGKQAAYIYFEVIAVE